MSDTSDCWGVHMGVHVGTEPVEKNYIVSGSELSFHKYLKLWFYYIYFLLKFSQIH